MSMTHKDHPNGIRQTDIDSLRMTDEDDSQQDVAIPDDIPGQKEHALDFSNPLRTRLKCMELLGEDGLELMNRLTMMYQFSGTTMLRATLTAIAAQSSLPMQYKLMAAMALCAYDPELVDNYEPLHCVCKQVCRPANTDLPTPCKVDAVMTLLRHERYLADVTVFLCTLTNDSQVDEAYRYKIILSLENREERHTPLKEVLLRFFRNDSNTTRYRILAGQLLLRHLDADVDDALDSVQVQLLTFGTDTDEAYNRRADAIDVLMRLGTVPFQENAKTVLGELGRQAGPVRTVFENAQNVHDDTIEQSVMDALECLATVKGAQPFPYVRECVEELAEERIDDDDDGKEQIEAINIALNRIDMDRAVYTRYNCSLKFILTKVWQYMQTHDAIDVMKGRLLEELVEMADTCSTGFAGRLVNVIAGFGDFNVRISWRDQLVANFAGRLNARARAIVNEDQSDNIYGVDDLEAFQGAVLDEMTVEGYKHGERLQFLTFLRATLPSLRDELYQEFKEYITDTDFDLYFRVAVSTYETGDFV